MSLIRSLADSMDDRQDLVGVWNAAVSCLPQLGLSKVVFMDLSTPNGNLILSNACENWLTGYREDVRAGLDPFAGHCLTTLASQLTGIGHLERHRHLSKGALTQIAAGSSALDINTGLSVPILVGADGAGVGVNLMTDHNVTEFAQLRAEHESEWRAWSHLLFAGLNRTSTGETDLTARERDCLAYVADGLRTTEVAYRIGISEGTVELHLRKARKRLGATTRDQAVAIAIRKRLI